MQTITQIAKTLSKELASLDGALKSADLDETLAALALVAADARKLCDALGTSEVSQDASEDLEVTKEVRIK